MGSVRLLGSLIRSRSHIFITLRITFYPFSRFIQHVVPPSLQALRTPTILAVSNYTPVSGTDVTSESAMSETAARATIFARIVSLMNGRSGLRPEVLRLLVDLLNKRITPLLARDQGEGAAIAKAVIGAGLCLYEGQVR